MRDPNGLNYHRARYYDPGIGIWTALDPFEGVMDQPMSLNGYGYVHGNPVTNVDPSGEIVPGIIGAATGAIIGGGVGFVFGHTYGELSWHAIHVKRLCGCDRYKQAGDNRNAFLNKYRLGGAAIGAGLGAITGFLGGIGAIATAKTVGGVASVIFGVAGAIGAVKDISTAGLNVCNTAEMLLSVSAIALGLGAVKGNYRAAYKELRNGVRNFAQWLNKSFGKSQNTKNPPQNGNGTTTENNNSVEHNKDVIIESLYPKFLEPYINQVKAKIPSHWMESPARKKGGWRWQDPENISGNNIRIDPGNLNSPYPAQQVHHVRVTYRGQVIGRQGQTLSSAVGDDAYKAHIPLSDWLNWGSWYKPD